MAHALCLTDWITVYVPGGVTVIQPEQDYLDCSPYQDAAVYAEFAEMSIVGGGGGAEVLLQTSPIKDEAFFNAAPASGNAYLAALSSGPGVQPLTVVTWANFGSVVPVARWVRWVALNLGSGGVAQYVFRIWLSMNPAGSP